MMSKQEAEELARAATKVGGEFTVALRGAGDAFAKAAQTLSELREAVQPYSQQKSR